MQSVEYFRRTERAARERRVPLVIAVRRPRSAVRACHSSGLGSGECFSGHMRKAALCGAKNKSPRPKT
ncbi:hypothetical protein Y032_0432g1365 [Ancylostoma ceylanicum]|uniref:Uncharacterized protein n=1 Tax=Ancylostoma ceylanicum TaxID=53326 RepID=A0A016X084_9BILA|nr:hypothetical protein Y032_0432g1365 [Ancylostoma ceylanicum]